MVTCPVMRIATPGVSQNMLVVKGIVVRPEVFLHANATIIVGFSAVIAAAATTTKTENLQCGDS